MIKGFLLNSQIFFLGIWLAGCQPVLEPVKQSTYAKEYEVFLSEFISDEGRVIDFSQRQGITTSEGQAYGLWFALIANDKTTFKLILDWTYANLAEKPLGDVLPSWLWGNLTEDSSKWGIIDRNTASDADVWMAYSLLAAGELWGEPRYSSLGKRLANRILEQETMSLNKKIYLLPGQQGFVKDETVLLNPSYFSLTLFRGLASFTGNRQWKAIYESSQDIFNQLIDHNLTAIPDWVYLNKQGDVLLNSRHHTMPELNGTLWGSYDAIRTYLWLVWESACCVDASFLSEFLMPFIFIEKNKYPAEKLDLIGLQAEGVGGVGFSAILLPPLKWLSENQAQQFQESFDEQKLRVNGWQETLGYYQQVLVMFGFASLDNCVSFSSDGTLKASPSACHLPKK